MAPVIEPHQRGSEDRRKAKKTKHCHRKNRPKESLKMHLVVQFVLCGTVLLLMVFQGAASKTVSGNKGDNITLPCSSGNTENVVLKCGSKTAYGAAPDQYYRCRVTKSSNSCDLILHDLRTTDAGRCILQVFISDVKLSYDIHVNVNLTGIKGKEVMFDLPRGAESFEFLNREVWRNRKDALTDRWSEKSGRLTLKNFTSSDAGVGRVMNSTGGVMVTITIMELGIESKGKLNSTHGDKPDGNKQNTGWIVIVALVALVALAALAALVAFLVH